MADKTNDNGDSIIVLDKNYNDDNIVNNNLDNSILESVPRSRTRDLASRCLRFNNCTK